VRREVGLALLAGLVCSAVAAAPPADLTSATRENPLRPKAAPQLQAVNNRPRPASDEPPDLGRLRLPPGFAIEVYAPSVPDARSLARGPKGTVFVGSQHANKVYALVDAGGDGKLDRTHALPIDLERPNGVAYRDGSLYIAEVGRLLRLDHIDARLDDPPAPVVVTEELPDETHHGWRFIRFGPDGRLYLGIGAPCNVCKRKEPIFATIARLDPDGTDFEVFASGVRNTVGFDWHPQTQELWFTDNGRDGLGNDLPPDELGRAPKSGMHFGFPYCHAGVILDPEFGEERACTEFEPPVRNLGPHTAALGMRFYTGAMFPPEYRNAIFVAEHGSWNRERKFGYRVMVVRLDGDRVRSYEPFVTGWLDEKSDEAWGRPVDVEVLDDGSMLISDDHKGIVYRVTYKRS
jgi:glucose/arabinose dehydrogenase